MTTHSPLAQQVMLQLGPLPITRPVLTTWGIMLVVVVLAWLGTRRARTDPGPWQATLEILVETLAQQVDDVMHREPWPYLSLIGTLFIFLACANAAAVLPGVKPPTANIETPAALALIVFFSVHVFGIRARGLKGYLSGYLKPNPLLLPLNLLGEFTRTFSLMIRLFGNIMSHEFVIAIVVLLAGLLVPVPFLGLAVLIGLIQAYIFTVLATVFIGAAVSDQDT